MKLARIAFVACLVLTTGGKIMAQDRMPPIPSDKQTEAQKKVVQEITAGPRGAQGLIGPFIPLLRSPDFMDRLQNTGEYLRYHNTIGTQLTEFTILVTSREWTQNFEWYAHEELAQKAGVPAEVIAAVRDGGQPSGMSDDQALVYDFCTELHKHHSVSDATYARAVKRFGEQGVVDLTGLTGYYTLLSMIMNVARTPLPAGAAPKLAPFPH
jgi:4-carboxymuconolactone decarboxylase